MNLYRIALKIRNFKPVKTVYDRLIVEKRAKRMNESFKENGITIAKDIEDILSNSPSLKDKFFLDYGGLLGLIRNGEFIKWDLDLDYGLIIDNQSVWIDLEKKLKSENYTKTREFTFENRITEQTYEKDGCSVDYFGHFLLEKNSLSYSYYRKKGFIYNSKYEYHVMRFLTTKLYQTEIYSGNHIEVHIPNDVENYLEAVYTKDWRIPNPNWISGSGPSCEKLDDHSIAICKLYK